MILKCVLVFYFNLIFTLILGNSQVAEGQSDGNCVVTLTAVHHSSGGLDQFCCMVRKCSIVCIVIVFIFGFI